MAVFRCKMCGGTLEINGESTAVCEFCGTRQTLPTAKDENLQGLFNRANLLRMKSEFDKAEQIYERILQADEGQAEAHWGLILCKYGIEYVEDPVTFKRVPTCHRTSFDSVISDEDYKAALQYADAIQRGIYEAEAAEIDRLQKEILALSQKEEPYDVFICYKETDAEGKRTQDSAIANDIYHQLTQEGFKVFYSAISLEDKLGSAYEPCIFAALYSAKVMLVVGTKPEYFEAVWVKNEWGRFLKMMKNDRSKTLIPCYKDVDAYELPEEFSHLQAQDMAKIGFINDLVRGIKKLVRGDARSVAVTQENSAMSDGIGTNTSALLERGFLALEDGEWKRADEFFEQALNQNAKLTQAYFGKLLAELQVHKKEAMKDLEYPFDGRISYQKVLRFADDALKAELAEINEYIKTRNEKARLEGVYSKAAGEMKHACTQKAFLDAARLFDSISQYKDSAELADKCREMAEIARKDAIYEAGVAKMREDTSDCYNDAINCFERIPGWKDADEKLLQCRKEIAEQERFERKSITIAWLALGGVILAIIACFAFIL
ncbi:MAG: toll/interleukin-1 receptor domain-containing protein [Ruminococcaceae bacterium]|nr:toll/interleukin-1 receptor domain-containing protein [Oscillospiraceae bacterium]